MQTIELSVSNHQSTGQIFQGETFVAPRDQTRLTTQILRVGAIVRDGAWRTIQQLCQELTSAHPDTRFPEASVSARLRDLRKIGYAVERRYLSQGLFEYRVAA